MRRLLLVLVLTAGCAGAPPRAEPAQAAAPTKSPSFREAVQLIAQAREAMKADAWAEALALADRALAAAPQALEAERIRGEALVQLERFDEAVAAFDRVIARDPNDVLARYLRTFALFRAGHHQQADEAAASLLADLPEDSDLRPSLLCSRAIIAARSGREDDSIAFRMQACAQDENSCCP